VKKREKRKNTTSIEKKDGLNSPAQHTYKFLTIFYVYGARDEKKHEKHDKTCLLATFFPDGPFLTFL